jgi:hypothetical protein
MLFHQARVGEVSTGSIPLLRTRITAGERQYLSLAAMLAGTAFADVVANHTAVDAK